MADDGSTERFDWAHRPEHVEGLAEVRRPMSDHRLETGDRRPETLVSRLQSLVFGSMNHEP